MPRFVRGNGKISPCFKLRKRVELAGQIWLSAREKVSVYAAFWAVRRSKSVRGGVFFVGYAGLVFWLKRAELHVRKQRGFAVF